MRIVFDDIKESLAPNFKGGEKSFASKIGRASCRERV